jgi:hypothetical protein
MEDRRLVDRIVARGSVEAYTRTSGKATPFSFRETSFGNLANILRVRVINLELFSHVLVFAKLVLAILATMLRVRVINLELFSLVLHR